MYKILFICMGNICRSPSAEGFLRARLAGTGLEGQVEIDSAGTHSYHLGHPPDPRAVSMASGYGVDIAGLRARKVTPEDFRNYDLILAMDERNLDALEEVREHLGERGGRAEVRLLMEFSPRSSDQRHVPDPYYGTEDDFRLMCELLEEATGGLIDYLAAQAGGEQAGTGS